MQKADCGNSAELNLWRNVWSVIISL